MKPRWGDDLRGRYERIQRFFAAWYGFHPDDIAPLWQAMTESPIMRGPEVTPDIAMLIDDLMRAVESPPKEKQMKFKVGDRVRIISHNFAHGKTGCVECVGGGWSSTLRYAVLLDGADTYRFSEIELELIESSTERRLIEALRPFAERALSAERDGWETFFLAEDIAALDLLRELGEYPETCKECGQEIRK